MKNKGGILALLITFVLISGYYLIRTWKVNQIRKEASAFALGKDGNVDTAKKTKVFGLTLETRRILGFIA
jgi:SecD/SecF fusion protein